MASKRPLYDVLGVSKDTNASEIARVYRQLALKYHPDRNPEGAAKFKEIANAYSVLSDPEKRRVYDSTGVDPSVGMDMGSEVTAAQRSAEMRERVQMFYASYAGSPEETSDVIERFNKCKGNFRRMVLTELLFDNGKVDEVKRLQDLVHALVKQGKLKCTEAWKVTCTDAACKQIEKTMQKERKRAAEALKSMGLSSAEQEGDRMQALQSIIAGDQEKQWTDMVSHLAEKYAKPKKSQAKTKRSEDKAEKAAGTQRKKVKK
ncbi:DnaJ domain [Trypanosoma vivax]|uniref:Putative chaperone protein DNAj n=1 Tax=Trypanosoma vivax (strain Y486) TaxID=1055687 RepID=G0U7R7_TRYVY|nr:putative chaperone protein DNAj [Trypanosoma vivax]KAH8620547.1 DnaJ domain [Trypanosoma vivax]CCC51925.1 putative chaperone protein DNAj [Trypanosoma vivax Y486]